MISWKKAFGLGATTFILGGHALLANAAFNINDLTPQQQQIYDTRFPQLSPIKQEAATKAIDAYIAKRGVPALKGISPQTIAIQFDNLEAQPDEFVQTQIDQIPLYVNQFLDNRSMFGDNFDNPSSEDIRYRALNKKSKEKFHRLVNAEQYKQLLKEGWESEGIAFFGCKHNYPNAQAIYALVSPTGVWHYTHDSQELKDLVTRSWKVQGEEDFDEVVTPEGLTVKPAFFVKNIVAKSQDDLKARVAKDPNAIPDIPGAVHRLYNKKNGGEHLLTTNRNEAIKAVRDLGWEYEGIFAINFEIEQIPAEWQHLVQA